MRGCDADGSSSERKIVENYFKGSISLSFALQWGSRTVSCVCSVCVRRRRRPLRALTFRQCFQQTRLHIATLHGVRHVSWASTAGSNSLFGEGCPVECVLSRSCKPTAERKGTMAVRRNVCLFVCYDGKKEQSSLFIGWEQLLI